MKLASSSASFNDTFAAGTLTQLEWIDLCARELALDGVVFDTRHFPRTDDDYLAQCKKLAIDLGLTVAALSCDALLSSPNADGDGPSPWMTAAVLLGAPLAIATAPPAGSTAGAWADLVATARSAAAEAKRCNVVLAIRNAGGTLCANAADLKRLAKDVDSSWLRFALDPAALESTDSPADLIPKAVIALHADRSEDAAELGRVVEALAGFGGFLSLDTTAAGDPRNLLGRLVSDARTVLAQATLEHRRP